jgi:hypothetical protein
MCAARRRIGSAGAQTRRGDVKRTTRCELAIQGPNGGARTVFSIGLNAVYAPGQSRATRETGAKTCERNGRPEGEPTHAALERLTLPSSTPPLTLSLGPPSSQVSPHAPSATAPPTPPLRMPRPPPRRHRRRPPPATHDAPTRAAELSRATADPQWKPFLHRLSHQLLRPPTPGHPDRRPRLACAIVLIRLVTSLCRDCGLQSQTTSAISVFHISPCPSPPSS